MKCAYKFCSSQKLSGYICLFVQTLNNLSEAIFFWRGTPEEASMCQKNQTNKQTEGTIPLFYL